MAAPMPPTPNLVSAGVLVPQFTDAPPHLVLVAPLVLAISPRGHGPPDLIPALVSKYPAQGSRLARCRPRSGLVWSIPVFFAPLRARFGVDFGLFRSFPVPFGCTFGSILAHPGPSEHPGVPSGVPGPFLAGSVDFPTGPRGP